MYPNYLENSTRGALLFTKAFYPYVPPMGLIARNVLSLRNLSCEAILANPFLKDSFIMWLIVAIKIGDKDGGDDLYYLPLFNIKLPFKIKYKNLFFIESNFYKSKLFAKKSKFQLILVIYLIFSFCLRC